jgi:hypothetical protein
MSSELDDCIIERDIRYIYKAAPPENPRRGTTYTDGLTAWGHDQTSIGRRQAHVLSLSIHLSFHLGSVWF